MMSLTDRAVSGKPLPLPTPLPRAELEGRLSLDCDTNAPIVNYWDSARRVNVWSHISFNGDPILVGVEGPLGDTAFSWYEPEPISIEMAAACSPLLWEFLADVTRPPGLYSVRWTEQMGGLAVVQTISVRTPKVMT